jgi:hypothetical protein
MEQQIRIAVILAGQLRYWDITSKIFEMYNQIDSNIQYDFFLSTWDDAYFDVKYEITNKSFLKAYELINPTIINPTHDPLEDYRRYPYLLKRVNQLKNDYQREYDIKYDCVISTRPDVFFSLHTLFEITQLINNSSGDKITPNTIYADNAGISEKMTIPNLKYTGVYHFTMADFFVIGHENAINIHANIFDDMYVNSIQPNLGVHITPAEHIINNKLNCKGMSAWVQLVRHTHVDMLTKLIESGEMLNLYLNFDVNKFEQFKDDWNAVQITGLEEKNLKTKRK